MGAVLDHARENGMSEFVPLFYINGVLTPTIGGNMDVPDARPGKVLNITLHASYRATAAINASVEYKVRVTNIIGTETVTRFKGRIARRKFDTRVDQDGRPADVLTIDCISFMAERCRLAPDTPHTIYDPNRINDGTTGETIAQRILDTRRQVLDANNNPVFTAADLAAALPNELDVDETTLPFDEDGALIYPVFEQIADMALSDLMERILVTACGFTSYSTTLPDYPVGRLDVSKEGGWWQALAAVLEPHEVIWREDEVANTITVKQPEWTLPGGYVPPELHLDQAIPSISDSDDQIVNVIELVHRHNGADAATGWADYRTLPAVPVESHYPDRASYTTALLEHVEGIIANAQDAIAAPDKGAAVWLSGWAVTQANNAVIRAQDDVSLGVPGAAARLTQAQNDQTAANQAQTDAQALADGPAYEFSTERQMPVKESALTHEDGTTTSTRTWDTLIEFRMSDDPDKVTSSQLLLSYTETRQDNTIISKEYLNNFFDGHLPIGYYKEIHSNVPHPVGGSPGAVSYVFERSYAEKGRTQWELKDGEYVETRSDASKSGALITLNITQSGVLTPRVLPAIKADSGQVFANTEPIPFTTDWGVFEYMEETYEQIAEDLTQVRTTVRDLITNQVSFDQTYNRTGTPSKPKETKREREKKKKEKRRSEIPGVGVPGAHAGAETRIVLKDDASIAAYGIRQAASFDALEIPRTTAIALARLRMQPEPPAAALELPDPDFSLDRTEVRRIFDRDGDQGLFVCAALSESWGEDQWLSQTATFRKRRVVS
jgi:hypothetical protein